MIKIIDSVVGKQSCIVATPHAPGMSSQSQKLRELIGISFPFQTRLSQS